MTNMQAEVITILEAVKFWETEKHATKTLETRSLVMLNIIKRNWRIPWEVIEIVEEIQRHIQQQVIDIQHIYR